MKKLLILITILTAVNISYAQRYRGSGEHPKFRFGLQGGYSYRLARVSDQVHPDFRSYVQKLKSGYHVGADGAFFINRTIGFGIKYSGFRASNKMDIVAFDSNTYNLVPGTMSNKITVHYIGPSFSTRYISQSEAFHFVASVSLGYLSYTDKAVQILPLNFKSATLGVVTSAAADFAVHENVFLGAEISLLSGSLTYFDIDAGGPSRREELPEGQYESLSRIDFSAGVKFNF